MRFRFGVLLLLACPILAGCGRHWLAGGRPSPHAPATAAAGKLVIEAKSLLPVDFSTGRPTRCALIYAVFNNTTADLTSAEVRLGPYGVAVPPLPAHAQFMNDLSAYASPVNGSCVATANAVVQAVARSAPVQCSLKGHSADDCAGRANLLIDADEFDTADIVQAEATQKTEYVVEQQRLYNAARAQAWAARGRLQQAVGAVLAPVNPAVTLSFAAIIQDGYDPGQSGPTPAPSAIAFCRQPAAPTPPTDQPPPAGVLTVLDVRKGQFDLADWYRLRVACPGQIAKTAWLRAADLERLLLQGQLVKTVPAPAPVPAPLPTPPPAAPPAPEPEPKPLPG